MRSPIDKKIILASNSPRRRQLLKEIIPDFQIAESREVNESYSSDLSPDDVAPYLSQIKAEAYLDLIKDEAVLITADTVVILENEILGKPSDKGEAFRMLKKLSGKKHKVVTGITIKSAEKTDTFSCETSVYFDKLTDSEIMEYIDEFKPFDKAGSYGIQEWIGCRGISHIEGCFYNVMGLPINTLYNRLSKF